MIRFQTDFEWSEFASRRAKIFDAMKPGAIAVLQGAGPVRAYNRFRQTNEFYYLSGIEVPSAYLVLRQADRTCTIYLAAQPEDRPLEDRQLGPQDADLIIKMTGVDAVLPHSELSKALFRVPCVYLTLAPSETDLSARDVLEYADRLSASEPLGSLLSRDRQFVSQVISRSSGAEIINLTPLLDAMRTIKSPAEIELLRKAGKLSADAVTASIKATKHAKGENDFEAIAHSTFLRGGARGLGYKCIIPCGQARIWDSHYIDNDQPLIVGELVLMDCAPDVNYYTNDIGRMWPVNGKYSPEQRELYSFVVKLHEAVLERIRPGVTAQQILNEMKAALMPVWEQTNWSRPAVREAAKQLMDFRGTFSHAVGMAVHDCCPYWGKPLEVGMVFTIDPQLWIRDERIYIRVEDTVLVTETGVKVLTEGPPRDPDETEALIASGM